MLHLPGATGNVYLAATGQNPDLGDLEPWVQTPTRQLDNSSQALGQATEASGLQALFWGAETWLRTSERQRQRIPTVRTAHMDEWQVLLFDQFLSLLLKCDRQ